MRHAVNIINFILGIFLTVAGRKLFWLFVGGMGFVISLSLAYQVLRGQPAWVLILLALFIGVIGALLAVFLEKAAILFGGFLAGAYLLGSLAGALGWTGQSGWILYLIGGVLGGVLVAVLFEWSLILLSSLVGGLLVIEALNLRPALTILGVLLVFLAGIGIQAGMMSREGHPKT
jgi:hypothetical protein